VSERVRNKHDGLISAGDSVQRGEGNWIFFLLKASAVAFGFAFIHLSKGMRERRRGGFLESK
jgi:hypothetical protein